MYLTPGLHDRCVIRNRKLKECIIQDVLSQVVLNHDLAHSVKFRTVWSFPHQPVPQPLPVVPLPVSVPLSLRLSS